MKALAALALIAAYGMQTYSSVVLCRGTPFGLWLVTTIALAPAFAFLVARRPPASIASTIVLIPFFVFANHEECVRPYQGGGAAMAYVAVFLFGVPASVVAGLVSSWYAGSRTAVR